MKYTIELETSERRGWIWNVWRGAPGLNSRVNGGRASSQKAAARRAEKEARKDARKLERHESIRYEVEL